MILIVISVSIKYHGISINVKGFSEQLFVDLTIQSGFLIVYKIEKLFKLQFGLCFGFQKYIGIVFYWLH